MVTGEGRAGGVSLNPIRIVGTGSAVPDRVVTNADLEAEFSLEAGWISERTGIAERRWASCDAATSHLVVQACRKALQAAAVGENEVDLLICATSTPDHPVPGAAVMVHGGLGMRTDAGAFDLDAACAGWIHALHIGSSLLATAPGWRHVLVAGGDCWSLQTDPADRATRVIFGDGAGAVLLGRRPIENASGLPASGALAFWASTDSAALKSLWVPGGGVAETLTKDALEDGRQWLHMDGRAVRDFAVPGLAESVERCCAEAGYAPADIDLLVPHQSNGRIIEAAGKLLGIAPEKVAISLDRFGNTGAGSVPLTLDAIARAGRINEGDLICFAGYGAGLSRAAMLMRW